MTSTNAKLSALRAATDSSEYGEIVPLFIEMYQYILGREGQTGIRVDMTGIDSQVRISNGFPLISAHEVRVDNVQAAIFVNGLVDIFSRVGREGLEELMRIGAGLSSGVLDTQALICAIMERSRVALDEAAAAAEVPAPLLEYLLEIPLKTALELEVSAIDPAIFAGWEEGHCPFCGSRAGMAELLGEEGQRRLVCSACSTSWPFKRLKCPYCANEDPEKLSYFTAGNGATRVDTCKGCSRYIKTRDSRKGGDGNPIEIEDLLTMHLDILASREGFERGK